MRDLLVIVPTRGRLDNVQRLLKAMQDTCTAQTDLVLGVDDGDRSYDGLELPDWAVVERGPRQPCWAWTNQLALGKGTDYRAVASLGDDHEPLTPSWDTKLLAATGRVGIAYGNDTVQGANLPTAPVMSSSIPLALGWMFYPGLRYFADNVWRALGFSAECLTYVPEVTVKHYHYTVGTAERDQTYAESEPGWDRDRAAYEKWLFAQDGLARDADVVRGLMR